MQKTKLPSAENARAPIDRTILNIFSEEYKERAFGDGGGVTLSSYENVVVIDAGGNGDYATLTEALAGESSDDTIFYVFGHVIEPGQITIEDRVVRLFLTPESILDLGTDKVLLKNPSELRLYGTGKLTSANTTATIDNDMALEPDVMSLIINGPLTVENTHAEGTSVRTIYAKPGLKYDIRFAKIAATVGIPFDTVADPSVKFGSHIRFIGGSTYSINSASTFANAPFYHCVGDLALNKITFESGNYSNVFEGYSPGWRGTSAVNFTTTTLPSPGDFGYQTADNEIQINVGGSIRAITTAAP